MCNASCIVFGATSLTRELVEGRTVLEVGSYDANGSLRPIIDAWRPARYVGVDIEPGPGVDVVCRAEDLVDRFGPAAFDVVISTECIEHVREWRRAISGMKQVCRPGGTILITTRSRGFPYHAHPHDYWRYEPSDMEEIFADCRIEKVERDRLAPGVFLVARKPVDFVEKDVSRVELYSIVAGARARDVDERAVGRFQRRRRRLEFFNRLERNGRAVLIWTARKLLP
jgi:SAM-dependent methyltransferase